MIRRMPQDTDIQHMAHTMRVEPHPADRRTDRKAVTQTQLNLVFDQESTASNTYTDEQRRLIAQAIDREMRYIHVR